MIRLRLPFAIAINEKTHINDLIKVEAISAPESVEQIEQVIKRSPKVLEEELS